LTQEAGIKKLSKIALDDFVRLYPANSLKDQVRDPKETLSAFTVLKETFFTKEEAMSEYEHHVLM